MKKRYPGEGLAEGPCARPGWVRDCDLPEAPPSKPDALDRWPFKPKALHFYSGSNHEGEIRGLLWSGREVGICACEVGPEAIRELELILRAGVTSVFVDSGAFGEVKFDPAKGRLAVHKPIEGYEWRKRLALYARLAKAAWVPQKLFVVAPDCVAHQARTLKRLFTYRKEIRQLVAQGVSVIVPVQKGEDLSMGQFRDRACQILELSVDDLAWGVPMKKDATTTDELFSFALSFPLYGRCRIHLLGVGPESDKFDAAIEAVQVPKPHAEISCDSVRIMAMVGRTNGKNGGPRKLTAARDAVLAVEPHAPVARVKELSLSRVLRDEDNEELIRARALGWRNEDEKGVDNADHEDEDVQGPHGDHRGHSNAAARAVDG